MKYSLVTVKIIGKPLNGTRFKDLLLVSFTGNIFFEINIHLFD